MATEKIYLDRNENNYGPSPACFDALRNASIPLLSTYTRVFTRGSKSILSERLAKDFAVTEDQILIGYGAEHLLKQVIRCYLGKGERLLIPSYSWWYYKNIADEVGGLSSEYPLIEGKDGFEFNVTQFLKVYQEKKPKVVFFASPNNPTGNSISLDDLKLVLPELKDAVVVLDEAYVYYDEKKHVRDLIAIHPKLVVIRTFSKYYALAGMRIGYAVCGPEATEIVQYNNVYLGYHRLSEMVAIAALDSVDYYRGISAKMATDKKIYYDELGRLPGFIVYKSDANFILVKIPAEIKADLKTFLTEKGLIIKFMDEKLLNTHLRITIGTQEQNKKLVEAILSFMAVAEPSGRPVIGIDR